MVIIALSGCDGSGKTTIALNLVNFLKKCNTRVGYRREFEYFLLKYLLRLLGNRVEIERRKFLRKESRISQIDRLKYRLWPFLVWLDSNIEIAYLKLFNKGLIVLDRCIVDHLAGFEHLKYIDKDTRDTLLKWSLKPDLIIVLDAPPEVMYKRKKKTHDYQLDFYKEQRKRYLDIAQKLNAPVVRTDKSLDESLAKVLQYILLRFSKAEDLVLHLLSDPIEDSNKSFATKLLENINWNDLDLKYLIIEASKNNIEFPFYERLYSYLNNNIVEKILRIVEGKYRKFLEILSMIAELFEKSGVDYVVFKTIPPYKHLPRDIDVLVSEKDLKKSINLLISKGFRLTKTHIIHKEVSLVKDDIEIDLHWQVEWMGNSVVDGDSILRNSIAYKLKHIDINIPNSTYELLLVISHAILQHHYITLGEVHYIRSLIVKYNIDWRYILDVVCKFGMLESFIYTLLTIVAKDELFYGSTVARKVGVHVRRSRISSLLSMSEVVKPVVWLGVKPKRITNVLDMVDVVLTLYRRSRYKLTKELPYNTPLEEILGVTGGR